MLILPQYRILGLNHAKFNLKKLTNSALVPAFFSFAGFLGFIWLFAQFQYCLLKYELAITNHITKTVTTTKPKK
jgi:hypothetical protein